MEHSIDRETVIYDIERCICHVPDACRDCSRYGHNDDLRCMEALMSDAMELLKEQEAVVHPEPSCEMTYITDCCCDLCGVQLIREDIFCRCCGKRIEWEGR